MILGNLLTAVFQIETPQGEIRIAGYDYGMKVNTPEYPIGGWDLVHVAEDPQGEPDVVVMLGGRFRRLPG